MYLCIDDTLNVFPEEMHERKSSLGHHHTIHTSWLDFRQRALIRMCKMSCFVVSSSSEYLVSKFPISFSVLTERVDESSPFSRNKSGPFRIMHKSIAGMSPPSILILEATTSQQLDLVIPSFEV